MKITAEYLHEKWNAFNYYDGGYIQIEVKHALEWHVGYKEIDQKALVIISQNEPELLPSSKSIVKVLQYSADQWKKLSAFAMQKRMASPDENMALKYACQIPNKMPSGYQSQRLLALLDRALSEGFNL